MAARLDRAWKNFQETFPLFAAAILVEAVSTAVALLPAVEAAAASMAVELLPAEAAEPRMLAAAVVVTDN